MLGRLKKLVKILIMVGSGCGSVGRAVASDTRGLRIESSRQQLFFINFEQLYTVKCVLKRRKWRNKTPGMAHLKNKFNGLPMPDILFFFSTNI